MRIFNILPQLCGGCDSNGLTDLLQRQNSTKESEGFNVQSFNYGKSDTVAHVIAHRNITAELSVSDICEDNDLYFGGNENDSFRECDRNNYCVDNGSVYILRIGFDRNIGSNSQYVLNEAVNAQNQLNNNEDRTLVVVDVRGSETLQDWICNAKRIYSNRVLISKFVLMLFYFVIKHKQ